MESIYEVSYSANEFLSLVVENHIDDERSECRDPFELVAEQEEANDSPLASPLSTASLNLQTLKGFNMIANIVTSNLPKKAQKQVIKSIIGSLNSSIIGYTRGHIRSSKFENISRDTDVPTIDDYNDAEAAIQESNAALANAFDAGLTPMMPPLEVAEKLSMIRNWFADQLIQQASTQYDVPLSIADTLDFQIKRSPAVNEAALKLLAEATDVDFTLLKTLKVKVQEDDKTELTEMAGQIITLYEKFQGHQLDEDEVESVFDSLPIHIQYKLMSSAIKGLEKAEAGALMDLLRFSRLDGATDSKLVKAVRMEITEHLRTFSEKHAAVLDEFLERGGMLPDVPDMLTSTKPLAVAA